MSESSNVINELVISSTGQEGVRLEEGMYTGNITMPKMTINFLEPPKINPVKLFSIEDDSNEDQSWFWTKEWQLGENEADRDIIKGDTVGPFDDIKDALHALKNAKI